MYNEINNEYADVNKFIDLDEFVDLNEFLDFLELGFLISNMVSHGTINMHTHKFCTPRQPHSSNQESECSDPTKMESQCGDSVTN